MHRFILFGLLLISQPAFSGEVAKQYQEGAFGAKWGSSIEDLKKSIPCRKT